MHEEVPLNGSKYSIGFAAVVMLVVLRVTIGWHFLYEGVWKIRYADDFSATPFLTQAKGPFAPLFYAMVPDLDGRQRLTTTDEEGRRQVSGEAYRARWQQIRDDVEAKYRLSEEQQEELERIQERFEEGLDDYLSDWEEAILIHFESLDRFEAQAADSSGSAFERKRTWDRMHEFRRDVYLWLDELEELTEGYKLAIWQMLDDDQRARGALPARWTTSDALDLLVTYSLTAIGLCLMVGLFTRLAALGGAGFLLFVVLSQFPWPTVYPPAPEVVGHSLLVDKNVVEMVALLLIATTAVGRWGGLDHFLHHFVGRKIEAYFTNKV